MWKVFLVVVFFLCVGGCDNDNVVSSAPQGTYAYNAYDSAGTLLVQGWFTLAITDSAHISGEWHFAKVGDPKNIGPHVGDGHLVGSFDQGLLFANLNPNYVDNNVFLCGTFSESRYSGVWTWSGFPGPLNRGSFQATKR